MDTSAGMPSSLAATVMSKYEIARVICVRAQQVSNGGALFIERKPDETISDAVQRELLEGKTPLKLVRYMPDGSEKVFNVRDMVVREDLLQPSGYHI